MGKRTSHKAARALLLCALLSAIAPTPCAQPRAQEDAAPEPPSSLNLHQWGALTLFHGLPSSHVRAIAQDADGVLWFGTDGGLAKYDGRRVQKAMAPGLPAGPVRALALDGEGALWVGTDAGGGRLLGNEFRPIPETAGHPITSVSAPANDQVLLTSGRGTVFTCSRNRDGSFEVRAHGPRESPLLSREGEGGAPLPLNGAALAGPAAKTLVLGTSGRGLLAIDGGAVRELATRPRPYFITSLRTDAQGRVWFGAEAGRDESGLYSADEEFRPAKVGARTGTVTALCFDARGDLWAGTAERGAFRYRGGREVGHFSFENSAGGLRSNLVYAVFADREGVVWFGTDRGVCRYDPRSAHAERVAVDPQSNFVHALFESAGGRLWCGANRGLFAREPGAAGWQPVEQLTDQAVHAIAEGEGGRLLVGASDGLYVSDAALTHTGQPTLTRVERAADKLGSGDGVRAICRFRGATFIGSYGRGVERLGELGLTPVWPLGAGAARERQVVSLYADGESRLWVGTAEAGVFVYDGRETRPAAGLEALRGSAVWAIAGTADTILWLATGRGLYRFQAGALAPALAGYDARGLAAGPSPESVWCATAGGGLFKVADGEEAGPLAARLDTEHGLPSDSVFAVHASRSPSGGEVLWVGTNRGVAAYEPGREPAVVRVVRVLGKRAYQPEEWHSGLRLEYPQNSLVVETAAASSRTFPEQFQYSFLLLDGAGRAVKRALSPDAQFVVEGLRPGRYRVEARAYTKDLTPSEPLGLAFEVAAAPFPVTTVALSTWLALALLALSWGYRQNRRLAGANRALAETRRQLATETETERRRIARDLHDQTLADLRRLMLLADGPGNGAGLTPLFRADIESISTEIRRICEDLSPSVLENVGLTAALEWSLADAVAQLPEGRKFDYEFACGDGVEERLRLSPEVQIQIYRIVQEALSNVCRHAAPGHVRLAAEIAEDGAFVVTLADDGSDFDAGRKRPGTGRGLSNLRSRASLIEAELSWRPRPGGGTVFTLRKPRTGA